MAIKEELGFLEKIISLDLTNDSYLKAMLHKANYHMRNEETDQGYNFGRCLVEESKTEIMKPILCKDGNS